MINAPGGFWGSFWPAIAANLAAGVLVGAVVAVLGPRVRNWFRDTDLDVYVTKVDPDVDIEKDLYSLQVENTGQEPFDLDLFWHLATQESLSAEPHAPSEDLDRAKRWSGERLVMRYFSGRHAEPLYPSRTSELFTFTVNPEAGSSGIVTGYVSTQFGTFPSSDQSNVPPDQLPHLTTIRAVRNGE